MVVRSIFKLCLHIVGRAFAFGEFTMKKFLLSVSILALLNNTLDAQILQGYTTNGSNNITVSPSNPLPVGDTGYPSGATPITGNAQGTTGAVTGTLTATSTTTAFICGFHIDSTGSGSLGPITVGGLIGSNMIFQALAGANNGTNQNFTPCVPASAIAQNITITTTANPSASAVDVNAWGYIK